MESCVLTYVASKNGKGKRFGVEAIVLSKVTPTIECFHGHVIPRSGVQPSVLSYGALCSFRLLQAIGPG